jgi:hypothetical protein
MSSISLWDSWTTISSVLLFGTTLCVSLVTLQAKVISGLIGILINSLAAKTDEFVGDTWVSIGRGFLLCLVGTFPSAFAGYHYYEGDSALALVWATVAVTLCGLTFSRSVFGTVAAFFQQSGHVPDGFFPTLRSVFSRSVHLFISACVLYWLNTTVFLWNQTITKADAKHDLDLFTGEFQYNCEASLKIPFHACVDAQWQNTDHVQHCHDLYTIRKDIPLFDQPLLVSNCTGAQQWGMQARLDALRIKYINATHPLNPFGRNPLHDLSYVLNDFVDTYKEKAEKHREMARAYVNCWLWLGGLLCLFQPKVEGWQQHLAALGFMMGACFGVARLIVTLFSPDSWWSTCISALSPANYLL